MKNIALVTMFAASLVAQQAEDPGLRAARLELAKVIAVEEQEQDLTKAERLYRAALADQKLSQAARGIARQRLGNLLRRLGKLDEARQILGSGGKGAVVSLDDVTNGTIQDPERFKKLQLKARALIEEARKNRGSGAVGHQADTQSLSQRLMWIGEPAVPEALAALEPDLKKPRYASETFELLHFLWQHGGASADKFLIRAAKSPLAATCAERAVAMRAFDADAPVVRAYLDHEDWNITMRFLMGRGQATVRDRIDAGQWLRIAERGDSRRKAYALRQLPNNKELSDEQRDRAHALCREALKDVDPDLAAAAEEFLASHVSQQSAEGLRMLFAVLPDLYVRSMGVAPYSIPGQRHGVFDAKQAATILPMIRDCVASIGEVQGASPVARWLSSMMFSMPTDAGEPYARLLLQMWDLGYDVLYLLPGRATKGTALAFLKRYDRVDGNNAWRVFSAFGPGDLGADALPVLKEIAESNSLWSGSGNVRVAKQVVRLVVQTQSEDAAGLLLDAWTQLPTENRGNSKGGDVVKGLLDLGKTVRTEPVRDAMRKMVQGDGGPKLSSGESARLVLALMSMGDEGVLDLVATGVGGDRVAHPYAVKPRVRSIAPIRYLIYDEPNPPHGYSESQVLDVVARFASRFGVGKNKTLSPAQMSLSRISDLVLIVLADQPCDESGMTWQKRALARLEERLEKGAEAGALAQWFQSAVAKPNSSLDWFDVGGPRVGARFRDLLQLVLAKGNADAAGHAFRWLWRLDKDMDLGTMLKHRHSSVRVSAVSRIATGDAKVDPARMVPLLADSDAWIQTEVANYLGAKVYKPAVAGLIEQLRDSDAKVRKAAADALTRIRFYHEQQAHWDRVLKGLDATPASAAEKLLLQGKPDADKSQRLLAIQSLGVLGVPEALPFLIDWSQEKDAEIAAAASKAIRAIHLNPRR